MIIQEIDLFELEDWRKNEYPHALIDVREPEEHQAQNIGGQLVPLSEIMQIVEELPQDKAIVFYCKRGIRSKIAIQRLARKRPDLQYYNLRGGIWSILRK